MKQIFLLLAVLIGFYACEDGLTTDIDTTLSATILIPVPVDETLKSTNGGVFTSTDTLSLKDEDDLANYIDRINEILINGANYSVSITPIQDVTEPGEITIELLTITIDSTSFECTMKDITSTTSVSDLNVTSAMLSDVSARLFNNKELVIRTSGNTNKSPAEITLKIDFDTTVTAEIL